VPADLPLSRRLQRVFGSRVAALPAASRHLLLVAALDGSDDLAVVQAAAGRPGGHAELRHLCPAEREGLIHLDESTYRVRFRHPLIRSAVLSTSTLAERRAAHRVLAEVLHEQPDRRAWHLGEACTEPDEDVAGLLERSGRRLLQRGDVVAAVQALTRAAHLSPSAADRAGRLAEAAFIGVDAGRELAQAAQLIEAARQVGSGDREALYSTAVEVHQIMNGDSTVDTAHQMLVQAIENGSHGYDAYDPALEGAVSLLVTLSWISGRPERWDTCHKILDRLRPEVPRLLAVTVATQADPARTAPAALQDLEDLVAGLPLATDPMRIARIANACIYTDRLADVREDLWRALRQARNGGQAGIHLSVLPLLSVDAFLTGHWETSIDLADEGLRLCEEFSSASVTPGFQYLRATVAAARGETDSAEEAADAITRWGEAHGALLMVTQAQRVRVLSRLGQGDFEGAYQHAIAVSPPGQLPSHTPNALWLVMDLVESAVRTRRQAEAQAHVRAVQEAGIAALSPRLALLAGASAAMAATADDEALTLFEQALALPGIDQWPFETARVNLAHGERLRKARSSAEARKPLSAALAAFEELGARPWADRAKRELAATGWMVRRRSGPASARLTPQETQVAQLAASGLTNKQIAERLHLSPRTVGGHLAKVFPKLSITSRAALRDALTNLGT
jgi:DNA-binding CsgD family transcriptional regulator